MMGWEDEEDVMGSTSGVKDVADRWWLELRAWCRVLGSARRGWRDGYGIDDGLAAEVSEERIKLHGMAAVLRKTAGSSRTRFVASATTRGIKQECREHYLMVQRSLRGSSLYQG